ncbi:UvrD/REP helicase [Elusimicrobium minutum Pei191]|uniref:DNA 3'-5' helicase n=1 Tax=Elusimicrobium minutum (strain Pei191) TaxID=445932 RepID=B2KE90_ELUMP|nr:UvrD-helicase domain-containing protein [Elusimicrobium minutum]ACC98836.1 UvrD/REP helicase [Elusimicrobium minutum Pei191]
MTKITDLQTRYEASTVTDRNIVVEAGAGTGKTTLLISRLCYLMIVKNISVERIVALTFTEKAAAEIKIRLSAQLQKIIKECLSVTQKDKITLELLAHLSKEEIIIRAQRVLEFLERGFISTIHGFCSYILKAYPVEAGISPSAVVDEGQRRETVFKRLWNKWLEEELGGGGPKEEIWKRVLKEINLEDLYNYAFDMAGGKIDAYHPMSHAKVLSGVCFENAKIAEQMSCVFLPPGGKSRKIERALASASIILQEAAFAFKEGKFQKTENPGPEKLSSSDQAKGWDDENFETAVRIVDFARSLYPDRQMLIADAFSLVSPFVNNARDTFEAQGLISFDDLLVKTRTLLKNNLIVRSALKKQFEIIFIDEFQDTDPVQGELLLFLAEEEKSAAKVWNEIKLAPGKLFVVGDPKQSIYRFRGADITAYQLFTELILKQGGMICYLQTNFRSDAQIIDFVNCAGFKLIEERPGFQAKYVPINAKDGAPCDKDAVKDVIISSEQPQSADDYRHNQAEFTAKWIAENAGKLKLSNGSVLQYKDIAVLMRTSNAFNIFTEALKRYGVKYTVEEDKNFYTAQEITDILNLLSLLDNPYDKNALAGVLRSPFGGFNDDEIYQIFKQKFTDISAKKLPKGFERLGGFYKTLNTLKGFVGRISTGALVEKILSSTMFAELSQLAYNGEQTISNLQKFAALAAGDQNENANSLGQFLANSKDLARQARGEGESPLADEFLSAVSVMTIHKSKGLEFPVVFLADMFRQESVKQNKYSYSWFYDMHGLRAGPYADANLAFLEVQQLWHSKSEEARILYVALTRAKEKLFILGNNTETKKTPARHLRNAGLWPELVTVKELPNDKLTHPLQLEYFPYAEPDQFIYKINFTPEDGGVLKNAGEWFNRWAKRSEIYEKIKEEALFISPSSLNKHEAVFAGSSDNAALLGTLCHKMLENYDFKTVITPEQTAASAASLQIEDNDIIKEAAEIINNFTVSEVCKKLASMRVLAREMPFTYFEEGKIISGTVDVIVEQEGEIFVLDYKTDKTPDPSKYALQLGAYKRAVKKIMGNEGVKSGLVFLRTSQLYIIK